eukprot:187592-Pyramimonas_sp.AAC.1
MCGPREPVTTSQLDCAASACATSACATSACATSAQADARPFDGARPILHPDAPSPSCNCVFGSLALSAYPSLSHSCHRLLH